MALDWLQVRYYFYLALLRACSSAVAALLPLLHIWKHKNIHQHLWCLGADSVVVISFGSWHDMSVEVSAVSFASLFLEVRTASAAWAPKRNNYSYLLYKQFCTPPDVTIVSVRRYGVQSLP